MRAIRTPPGSTLHLLVLGVLADHPHLSLAANDLALVTDPLHRRTNLHDESLLTVSLPGQEAGGISCPQWSGLDRGSLATCLAVVCRASVPVPVRDAAPGQVIGRKFQSHAVSG